MKPLRNMLIVKPEASPEKTPGGILLPENVSSKSHYGIVVSVGSSCKDISVGDKILYSEYTATQIEKDGEIFIVMKDKDVLCILD